MYRASFVIRACGLGILNASMFVQAENSIQ